MKENKSKVLYSMVKDRLEREIRQGKYKTGDKLPSEFQLCRDYQVSRTTVRLALQQLEMEGKVNKVQGVGSFVSRPKIIQSLTTLTQSFADQMIAQNYKPHSKVQSVMVKPATQTIASQLQIACDDPVNEIIRIRYASDEPLQYETSYIPWKLAPGVTLADCEGSLYQLLKTKYQIHISRTLESIEPILVTEPISHYLQIPTGAPVFYLETTAYGNDGQPVEYSTGIFRGDRSKFTIERHYS